jgi:hypothetical protein
LRVYAAMFGTEIVIGFVPVKTIPLPEMNNPEPDAMQDDRLPLQAKQVFMLARLASTGNKDKVSSGGA